jgi:hypothetical protein
VVEVPLQLVAVDLTVVCHTFLLLPSPRRIPGV